MDDKYFANHILGPLDRSLRGFSLTVTQVRELAEVILRSVDPMSVQNEKNKAAWKDFESRNRNVEGSAVIGIQRKLPSTG